MASRTLVAAILIALSGTACKCARANHESRVQHSSASHRPIIIAGPKNVAMLPLLADSAGLFLSQHVAVRFLPLQTGKLAMDALLSGDVDIGVLVDTNLAYALFHSDTDLDVFCSIMEKTDDALVVRTDRGIRLPDDLIGRSIAYVPATTSDSFLWRFLQAEHVTITANTLLPMTPPALEAALVRGDVDAGAIWQPWRASIIKDSRPNAVEFLNNGVYVAEGLLVAKRAFIISHPDDVNKILRALIDADSLLQHSSNARRTLARLIPIDLSTLNAAWGEYRPHVSLSRTILHNLTSEGEHIRRAVRGFQNRSEPDYARLIDPAPLQAVDPQRVHLGSQ